MKIPAELVEVVVASVSAVVTAAAAWVVRKIEKNSLRKKGKLND